MATVVVMPKVGISVESCIITKWHKKKGDTVKEGDILFSYETDKASVDEEAKASGTILEIFCAEGDDVPVMQNVCVIGNPGEDVSAFAPKKEASSAGAAPAEETQARAAAPEATGSAVSEAGRIKVSPRARNLASRAGADLRMATPTGPEGRIIERDVQALIDSGKVFTKAAGSAAAGADVSAVRGSGIGGRVTVGDLTPVSVPAASSAAAAPSEAASAEPEFVAEKLPHIRRVIAKSMKASLGGMAQLTHNITFDATELLRFRAMFKASGAAFGLEKVTLNDMMLFAVSRTLKNYKALNANLIDDTLYYYRDVNLGVAVDTERGLLVPTLFAADKKSLAQISRETKSLIADAQKGSINPDLLRGGTFTVTNLGSLGVESFTPVINPPQTGILGVCTIVSRPREENGQIRMYPAMGLSLTFDHCAIDGAPAARFLMELKKNLENFSMLLAL